MTRIVYGFGYTSVGGFDISDDYETLEDARDGARSLIENGCDGAPLPPQNIHIYRESPNMGWVDDAEWMETIIAP